MNCAMYTERFGDSVQAGLNMDIHLNYVVKLLIIVEFVYFAM